MQYLVPGLALEIHLSYIPKNEYKMVYFQNVAYHRVKLLIYMYYYNVCVFF